MPIRRRKHPRPSWTVDAAGEPLEVSGACGLFIDMPRDDEPPSVGDWIATEAGSRSSSWRALIPLVDEETAAWIDQHAEPEPVPVETPRRLCDPIAPGDSKSARREFPQERDDSARAMLDERG